MFLKGWKSRATGSNGSAMNRPCISQRSWTSSGNWDPQRPCTAIANLNKAELPGVSGDLYIPSKWKVPSRWDLAGSQCSQAFNSMIRKWQVGGRSRYFSSLYICLLGRLCSVLGVLMWRILYVFFLITCTVLLSFSKMTDRRHCCNVCVFQGGFQVSSQTYCYTEGIITLV